MMLTHGERLQQVQLTQTRLAKTQLYVPPAPPCNDNRNVDSREDNPSLRLIDKVGASWQLQRASLFAAANRLGNALDVKASMTTKTTHLFNQAT